VLPMQHAGRREAIDVRGAAALTGAVVLAIVPLILGREQPAFEIVSLGFAVVALLASAAGYAAFAKRSVDLKGHFKQTLRNA